MIVDLVLLHTQPVVFAVVDEHDDVLFGAAGDVVELHRLVPVDRAVVVARHQQHRRRHRRNPEDGGVADVGLQVVVDRHDHTLLTGLDMIGLGDARRKVVAAVVADQVRDARARDGGCEDLRVRREVHRVKAAPRVAHHADLGAVHHSCVHHLLHCRSDTLHDRHAGFTWCEVNVGLEVEVAVLCERRAVVIVALGRIRESMQAVRQFLVEVHHHRVLLAGLIVGRIVKDALQRHLRLPLALDRVFDQLGFGPRVLRHKGIGLGGGLAV